MIQRKISGGAGGKFDENGWEGYKNGFGDKKEGDFWLGLEKIHQMTLNGNWKIMFKIRGTNGGSVVMIWNNFRVSSEDEEYRLTCGAKSASWGDFSVYSSSSNLASHDGAMFSTKDRDNDLYSGGGNCAKTNRGGFWYTKGSSCDYLIPPTKAYSSYRETKMLIAPM